MAERFVRVLYNGEEKYALQITGESVDLDETDDGFIVKVSGDQPADEVQVFKDTALEFRWRHVAPNGVTNADSGEGYKSKSAAKAAAKKLFPGVPIVEVES